MKNSVLLGLVTVSLFLAACSQNPFYHEHFMRGHVVNVNDDHVRVCIGEKDGAEVSHELNVYRVIVSGQDASGSDIYDRETVGKVKITRITGEHFAVASIIEGNINKHDIVEFSP